jgi:hypothetical protein
LLIAVSLSSPAAGSGRCEVNYVTHGTMHEVPGPPGPGCLEFVDDTGVRFEIVNPRGSWKEGMTGTIYAETQTEGACGLGLPVRVCNFDADFSRNVVGALEIRQFVECPGYVIVTGNLRQYLILNCEDFGPALCDPANVGRRLKAEVFVDTGVSICLGMERSTVIDYDFLP